MHHKVYDVQFNVCWGYGGCTVQCRLIRSTLALSLLPPVETQSFLDSRSSPCFVVLFHVFGRLMSITWRGISALKSEKMKFLSSGVSNEKQKTDLLFMKWILLFIRNYNIEKGIINYETKLNAFAIHFFFKLSLSENNTLYVLIWNLNVQLERGFKMNYISFVWTQFSV